MADLSYLGYNVSPAPTGGQGAYGAVPGQTAVPPSTYQQASSVYSGLPGLTSAAGDVIGSELAGTISPSTQSNIWNQAAARGVNLGQPNSPMSNEIGLSLTGTTTQGLQATGESNYLNFLSGLSNTQISPSLLTDISQSNATLAAAPDPAAAAAAQQAQFDKYYNQSRSPAGYGAGQGYNTSPSYSDFPGAQPAFTAGNYEQLVSGNTGGGYSSPYTTYSSEGSQPIIPWDMSAFN